jgi:hypothetical protein
MVLINLEKYLDDNVNIVEIFFVKNIIENKMLDVSISENIEKNIKYKKTKEENYKMYYMNDKIYVYELSNDNQYVISKNMKKNELIKNNFSNGIYILSSKIDKYPQYTFPCTNELDNVALIKINEYKISNRISLNVKTENDIKCLYIEYKHSPNVELDKMNEIINKIIKNVESILNSEDK